MIKNLPLFMLCSILLLLPNLTEAQSFRFERRILSTGTITEEGVTFAVSSDDAEQENESIDALFDDDLDTGWEGDPEDQNILTTGLRFRDMFIPKGAIIDSAFIYVWSHEGKTPEDVAKITIFGEATDHALTFNENDLIATRESTSTRILWEVAEEWLIWERYRTPDLKAIVQELVNREGWSAGNAMAFIMAGENQGPSEVENAREFESFENISDPEDGGDGQNHPERVPQLVVFYHVENAVVEIPIVATDTLTEEGLTFAVSSDDAEQENDAIDALYDDDLDAGWEGDPEDQNVLTTGLRFQNIPVPFGAKIDSAFIYMWSHEGKTTEDKAILTIYADNNTDSPTFSEDALITDRTPTGNKIVWTVEEEWLIWEKYRTPDLKAIVQEMVTKPTWEAGKPLTFIMAGQNQGPSEVENAREFESFENISDPEDGGDGQNHPERVPRLVIHYSSAQPTNIVQSEKKFDLYKMGTYATGLFDEAGAESCAFDATTGRIAFVNAKANSVMIVDANQPENITLFKEIDMSPYGGGVNSVDIHNGLIAIAVQANTKTDNGAVVFFDSEGNHLKTVEAGALPDMVAFSHDGKYALTANEGEPNDDYSVDPEGSITIVDLNNGVANATATHATFEAFNPDMANLRAAGVRIFGPNATVAQDLEPEFVAVSPDNSKAFVTLQEANAFAVVDIATATVEKIVPMGYKNHQLEGNGMDASNRSTGIEIKTWPVLGMYQPDAIKAFEVGGKTYYVTVNEGDSRDYDGYSEETRVKSLPLDAQTFPKAADLQKDPALGRLNTTTANGDTDGDGDFDVIYAYGARSFTIWDDNGALVFDSGDDLEQKTAVLDPENFNSNNDENGSRKSRSDDKGPEPEALDIAYLDGSIFALVGLERIGGVMVYDITDPNAPQFVSYTNNRNFAVDATTPEAGDLGPEYIRYVPADQSPVNVPLVIVSNEVSGTVTVFSVNQVVTSIFEAPQVQSLHVYPNPASDILTVALESDQPALLMLFNSQGQLVRQVNTRAQQTLELDVNQLPTGMYFIRALQNKTIYTQKVKID
jgi:hypothetical protein